MENEASTAPEMAKSSEEQRTEVLLEAGYRRSEEAAGWLHEAAERILDRYDGDLNNLLDEADGERDQLYAALVEFPGMDDAGIALFLREAQRLRLEVAPFAHERALAAAKRLGLPADARELMTDGARGQRNEELTNLVGALASSRRATSTTKSRTRRSVDEGDGLDPPTPPPARGAPCSRIRRAAR